MDNEKADAADNNQRIVIIYSRLEDQFHALEGGSEDRLIVDGPCLQFKITLDELRSLTNRDYGSFMPNSWLDSDGHLVCHTKDLRTQIGGLLGELRPIYMPGAVPYFIKESQPVAVSVNTSVNQDINVTQEVEVTLNIVYQVALKLEGIENSFDYGTPERNFITRLKGGLNTVKNYANLMALIMIIARDVGLDVNSLHDILRSLGIA